MFAQRCQALINVPRPHHSAYQKGHKERRQDVRLHECEDADHEEEEDDYPPDKAVERDGPSLTSRFIGLVKHWDNAVRTIRRTTKERTHRTITCIYIQYIQLRSR